MPRTLAVACPARTLAPPLLIFIIAEVGAFSENIIDLMKLLPIVIGVYPTDGWIFLFNFYENF